MEAIEKAKELVSIFGKENSFKVVDELLKRDKQWIDKLSSEDSDKWQPSDFDKSASLFNDVKIEIEKL